MAPVIKTAQNRDSWRRAVHNATKLRNEDGWRQYKTF